MKLKIKIKQWDSLAKDIKALANSNKIDSFAIITDSKVKKLYGTKLLWKLRKTDLEVEIFSFPKGEKSKSLATVEKIANEMVNKNLNRNSCVIALGGGVVGDVAGLVASTFMRSIPIIHIPTTFLSMLDSSIGGKTGINLKSGKNLIGTFYQPLAVFTDPYFLKTLQKKHLRNGLAEAIKCGIIASPSLFHLIENDLEKILKLNFPSLEKVIKKCTKIKLDIIEKDEKDEGKRQLLNYGHSFGHVLEKNSNYTLLHGFAISLGMVLANKKAVEMGLLKQTDAECIKNLLKRAGLPVYTMHKPTLKDLIHDKKANKKFIHLILPEKIGKATIKHISW